MKVFTQGLKAISKLRQGLYYANCDDLPYYNFVKVSITADLKWLVKSGHVAPHILSATWDAITEQYTALSQDENSGIYLELNKELYEINGQIIIIETLCQALERTYYQPFVDKLHALGYQFSYDPHNTEQYARDLRLTISQAKSLKIRMDQVQEELKELSTGEQPTEQSYWEQLAVISKWYGYNIDPKQLTVSEFISKLAVFKKANTPQNGITGED